MIIYEQIDALIRAELLKVGIVSYPNMVPTEVAYPLVMHEEKDFANVPDLGFEKTYNSIVVRFNIYGNKCNSKDIRAIAEQIETVFDRTKLEFLDVTGGKHLICNKVVNNSITYLDKDFYWLATMDIEFVCQKEA